MAIRADGRNLDAPGIAADAVEIVGLRGRNRIAFRRPGERTIKYLYPGRPVHYRTDESWQPYDLRWIEQQGEYVLRASDQDLTLADSSDSSPLIRMQQDAATVALTPIALDGHDLVQVAPVVTDDPDTGHTREGVLAYPGIFGDGTELTIRAAERGFRKLLSLQSAAVLDGLVGETLSFSWRVETNTDVYVDGEPWDGKTAVGEGVEFRGAGDVHWTWPVPIAYDAAGTAIAGRYGLRTADSAIVLDIQFDLAALRSAVFPLVLDPYTSASTDGYISGIAAAFADARATSVSQLSTGTTMTVGMLYSSLYAIARGFLAFDTRDILTSYTVTSALLSLTCITDSSDTDIDVYLKICDWIGTWATAANREADYDAALAAAVLTTWRNTYGMSVNTPYSVALPTSAIVKAGITKLAIMSRNDHDNVAPIGSETIALATSEHATAAYRPQLTVTAEPPTTASCIISRSIEGEFERITFAWRTDVTGLCVLHIPGDLDGTLYRFEARHAGSDLIGTTYTVRLLDAFGADVLMGTGESLGYNASVGQVITLSCSEAVHLPVPVLGRHTIEVDAGSDETSGLFELIICRDLARRLVE